MITDRLGPASAIPNHLDRFPDRALDRVYRLPDELRSYEEAVRLRHGDLADMPEAALGIEERRVRWRLDLDAAPMRRRWLIRRLAAIASERDRRRGQS